MIRSIRDHVLLKRTIGSKEGRSLPTKLIRSQMKWDAQCDRPEMAPAK
ncbi:MAG TPA: hypothetical protein V6C57_14690 [Coleofasciculaceae cyanobacterium]